MEASRTQFKFNTAIQVSICTKVPSCSRSLCLFSCRMAPPYMHRDLASNVTPVFLTQANQEYDFLLCGKLVYTLVCFYCLCSHRQQQFISLTVLSD